MCVQVTAIEPGLLRKKRRILIIDLFDVKNTHVLASTKLFVQFVYRHVSTSCQPSHTHVQKDLSKETYTCEKTPVKRALHM